MEMSLELIEGNYAKMENYSTQIPYGNAYLHLDALSLNGRNI